MSSLTSSSTLAEVEAAYVDNASYAEDGSVVKAKAFITACRILLLKIPKSTGSRNGTAVYGPDLIQREMATAQAWVTANDTSDASGAATGGPVVTRVSFENFR